MNDKVVSITISSSEDEEMNQLKKSSKKDDDRFFKKRKIPLSESDQVKSKKLKKDQTEDRKKTERLNGSVNNIKSHHDKRPKESSDSEQEFRVSKKKSRDVSPKPGTSRYFDKIESHSKEKKTKDEDIFKIKSATSTSSTSKLSDTSRKTIKPQLVIKEKVAIPDPSEDLFSKFIEVCLSKKDDEATKKCLNNVKKRYGQLSVKQIEDEEFRLFLNTSITKITSGQSSKFYAYIQEVMDEVKRRIHIKSTSLKSDTDEAAKKQGSGDDEEDGYPIPPQHAKKIEKLQRAIKECQEKIKKLETEEVDFDQDEDSAYIKSDRYKRKLVELCELLSKYVGDKFLKKEIYKRQIKRKDIADTMTGIQSVDEAIINFINSSIKKMNKLNHIKNPLAIADYLITPDYPDILQCIKKCNKEKGLDLSNKKMEKLAQNAFKVVGRYLQHQRVTESQDYISSYLDTVGEEDPAKKDSKLDEKLAKNKKTGDDKLNEIFLKYVNQQEGEPVKEDSESSVSVDDSEDERFKNRQKLKRQIVSEKSSENEVDDKKDDDKEKEKKKTRNDEDKSKEQKKSANDERNTDRNDESKHEAKDRHLLSLSLQKSSKEVSCDTSLTSSKITVDEIEIVSDDNDSMTEPYLSIEQKDSSANSTPDQKPKRNFVENNTIDLCGDSSDDDLKKTENLAASTPVADKNAKSLLKANQFTKIHGDALGAIRKMSSEMTFESANPIKVTDVPAKENDSDSISKRIATSVTCSQNSVNGQMRKSVSLDADEVVESDVQKNDSVTVNKVLQKSSIEEQTNASVSLKISGEKQTSKSTNTIKVIEFSTSETINKALSKISETTNNDDDKEKDVTDADDIEVIEFKSTRRIDEIKANTSFNTSSTESIKDPEDVLEIDTNERIDKDSFNNNEKSSKETSSNATVQPTLKLKSFAKQPDTWSDSLSPQKGKHNLQVPLMQGQQELKKSHTGLTNTREKQLPSTKLLNPLAKSTRTIPAEKVVNVKDGVRGNSQMVTPRNSSFSTRRTYAPYAPRMPNPNLIQPNNYTRISLVDRPTNQPMNGPKMAICRPRIQNTTYRNQPQNISPKSQNSPTGIVRKSFT